MNNTPAETVLRSLDAASPTTTAAERERAAATLERILATAPAAAGTPEVARPPAAPTQRLRRRLVLVPVAAAALAGGLVLAQGSAPQGAAYASWTPTPQPVAGAALHAADRACRSALGDPWPFASSDIDTARVALAERRGDHVLILYRSTDADTTSTCLVANRHGSTTADVVDAGSTNSAPASLHLAPRAFTQGGISGYSAGEDGKQSRGFSATDGLVGDDVVAVTLHAAGTTAQATVHDGWYGAWWPGPAFAGGPVQPSGEGGPEPIIAYDLTLADGTVIHDAPPAQPF